ncbi:DUF4389 domain-containing protein [Pseudobacteriovorax antillogorgiicola]|uniref:DUF4389 domain-containing protein n=1 Tax=Pseudobacteriovorax antillogorgiicola TaxID=1513793 RepID=A0A1Y6BP23_9BACT|nr:DUF4389 domain-containing protein [Pseudobacteriovorax antillogorgiicola]TCS53948.1 uncharacterized protein DUF4389 [Pseudobacteriovorax antillogorgiicola]SMF20138.1 protein of unknown function [Pseudobacteriovorax antillogorgiicola]
MDTEDIKENIQKPYVWTRLVHMVILFVAFRITELILYAIIILQFFMTMITGKRLENLDKLSSDLSHYMKNIMLYLSFNHDERPFPFSEWDQTKG